MFCIYTDEFMKLQLLPNGHAHTFSIIGDVDSEDTPIKTRFYLTMDTRDEEVYIVVVASTCFTTNFMLC